MEEQNHSFLANKYDVRKYYTMSLLFLFCTFCDTKWLKLTQATRDLESRIGKTADTYTSGVAALKKLSEMLQKKASFDLENINSSIGSQIEAVEQV